MKKTDKKYHEEIIVKPAKRLLSFLNRNKYHNIKVTIDGYKFDSKKEANRYQLLRLLERQKLIKKLEIHPIFYLYVERELICKYIADFRYYDTLKKETIVEDVKGVKTKIYRLKKKLLHAIHDITIEEI